MDELVTYFGYKECMDIHKIMVSIINCKVKNRQNWTIRSRIIQLTIILTELLKFSNYFKRTAFFK